jgi:UPF0755 protein
MSEIPITPPPRSTLWLALILATLLAFISGMGVFLWFERWASAPLVLLEPVDLSLERGMSLRVLSNKLAERGVVRSAPLFELLVRRLGRYREFKAGPYRFSGAIAPLRVIEMLSQGEVYTPVVYQIAVPEGFTVHQIAQRLAATGIADGQRLVALSANAEFLSAQQIPGKSLEGFLYPATYTFTAVPDAEVVARRMVSTFWKKLPVDYELRAAALGLSLQDAVTLASLIELETARDDERGLVAGVIWNRLQRRMPLGIDAAIIYGIPNFDGDLTFAHLSDRSNPYNTRVHGGLPPSAIGSPSLASLEAAIAPEQTEMLYYVVDAEDFSRHRFARTLTDHNKNVQAYLKARRRKAPLQDTTP